MNLIHLAQENNGRYGPIDSFCRHCAHSVFGIIVARVVALVSQHAAFNF